MTGVYWALNGVRVMTDGAFGEVAQPHIFLHT